MNRQTQTNKLINADKNSQMVTYTENCPKETKKVTDANIKSET